MSASTTRRFVIEAGMAVRGQMRREIERAAWSAGLEIETAETKGFFESLYRFTVTGDPDDVRRFLQAVESWAKVMND